MATLDDVRAIALTLPGTLAREGAQTAFDVMVGPKARGYCWVWLERLSPRAARVPNPAFLAVRVANLDAKEMLLMADPRKFFTEPHYDGYPAVLLRLSEIGREELRALLTEAWSVLTQKASRARPRGGVKLVSSESIASASVEGKAAASPRATTLKTSSSIARPRQDVDKKRAAPSTATRRAVAKSPAAKRPTAKKSVAKKVAVKKAAAKKAIAKKVVTKKAATKKAGAKRAAKR